MFCPAEASRAGAEKEDSCTEKERALASGLGAQRRERSCGGFDHTEKDYFPNEFIYSVHVPEAET